MNVNDPRHPWSRLTQAARQVPDDRDTAMPYGFATRIAALAFAQERVVVSLFDRFALRAVGVAGLLALLSVAVNYPALQGGAIPITAEDDAIAVDDGMAIVMDLTAD